MKSNWKNKILCGLCLLMLSFGFTGCSGCNKNTPNPDSDVTQESEEKEFSLNYHIYELALYDSFQLKVKDYDGLTWSSDQPNVVSVAPDGTVTANGYGSATVTVTHGTKTDNCIFTVPDEGLVPTIKTNTADEGIALLKGDTFALECAVDFDGTQFTDATFTFSSSDTATVSIGNDGKLKAEKLGEAVITVKASWRNFDEVYLTKNIPVAVNPDLSIELTAETNTLSTVTEKIDGKSYSNVCDIAYTVKIDGVDKTSETALEWVSSDPSVATVTDGVVTAHARGTAEITAQYTVEGKTYVSLPISIQAVAPTKALNSSRFVYNVNDNEQTGLTIEELQGEVYSVTTVLQDYTELCEIKSGTVTLDKKYLDTLRGYEDFKIETPIYSYVFKAVFATHIISNADELKTLLDSYYCNFNDDTKESTEGWYVVVTQDFSYNNSVGHGSYDSRFRGTFDGMGHTISNVTVAANGGMFGGLEGTIKNLAVDGLTATQSNCFLLAGCLYGGTVDNVFVRGSFLVPSNCGFVRLYGGSVSNCIVNITYPEGGEGAAYGEKDVTDVTNPENATVISNSYAIGNAAKFRPYDSQTTVYSTTEAFLSACAKDITLANGFNEYWSGDAYGINFQKTPVVTLTATEKERLIKTEDFTLNTAELLGDTVEYALIDNERVEVSQDGILQFKLSDFTKGETHVVQIRGNGKIIKQPFIIPTHQIGTWTEFTAFLDSYNAEKGNGSVNTASWYVILTDDIDCGNNTYGMAGFSFWKGTFNGLGHSVSNIQLWGQGGLLGRPDAGGVIENTAFLDIRATVADSYLLTGYAQGGIVRNVYLQGEFTTATTHGAMRNEGSGTVENVIVNAQFADGSTAPMFSKKGNVVLTEAYAIGNATAYVDGDTTTPVYKNVEEFLTAKGASLTAENGWNEYWSMKDGSLYFGDNKVE